jgi:hypothetical protein
MLSILPQGEHFCFIVLLQILMCQHLLPFLVDPAKEALKGMCRPPVADLVF